MLCRRFMPDLRWQAAVRFLNFVVFASILLQTIKSIYAEAEPGLFGIRGHCCGDFIRVLFR